MTEDKSCMRCLVSVSGWSTTDKGKKEEILRRCKNILTIFYLKYRSLKFSLSPLSISFELTVENQEISQQISGATRGTKKSRDLEK